MAESEAEQRCHGALLPWVASALLHAAPLALRASPAQVTRPALAPVELEIVAEPELRAALSPAPPFLESAGKASGAPLTRPVHRERGPLARKTVPPRAAAPAAPESDPLATPEPSALAQAPAASGIASSASESGIAPAAGNAEAPGSGGQRTNGGNAPGATGAGPALADPKALRERYLRELRQRVLERREYPHSAQRAGLQGVVCLRLSLTANGRLSELRATCGPAPEPLLQAALRAVRAAEPFRPLPSELGRELTIELPIVFQLDPSRASPEPF